MQHTGRLRTLDEKHRQEYMALMRESETALDQLRKDQEKKRDVFGQMVVARATNDGSGGSGTGSVETCASSAGLGRALRVTTAASASS